MIKKAMICMILLFCTCGAMAESAVVRLGPYAEIELRYESAAVSDQEIDEQIDFMLSLYAFADSSGEICRPELTDVFVQENLNCGSVEEYRQRLEDILLEEKQAVILQDAKTAFLNDLIGMSEVELDASETGRRVEEYRSLYQGYMQQAQLSWEDFCREYFNMSAGEFEDALLAQAEYDLSSELLLQALFDDMGITLSQEEFLLRKQAFQEKYALSDEALSQGYPDEKLRLIFEEELVWERILPGS